MERILARNSENISKVLALMTAHEYNVRNYYRNNRNIDIQFVFDRLEVDLSNNILNQPDISNQTYDQSQNQITYKKFEEIENQNETICPITQEPFYPQDNVAVLECGHYFKKDAFLSWSRRSRSCPSCRGAFR